MNQCPPFVTKTFRIVSDSTTNSIVGWTGETFTIFDPEALQQDILHQYFKHSNLNSFLKQLHTYGFTRVAQEPPSYVFYHPHFRAAREDLLPQIIRRGSKKQTPDADSPTVNDDVVTSVYHLLERQEILDNRLEKVLLELQEAKNTLQELRSVQSPVPSHHNSFVPQPPGHQIPQYHSAHVQQPYRVPGARDYPSTRAIEQLEHSRFPGVYNSSGSRIDDVSLDNLSSTQLNVQPDHIPRQQGNANPPPFPPPGYPPPGYPPH